MAIKKIFYIGRLFLITSFACFLLSTQASASDFARLSNCEQMNSSIVVVKIVSVIEKSSEIKILCRDNQGLKRQKKIVVPPALKNDLENLNLKGGELVSFSYDAKKILQEFSWAREEPAWWFRVVLGGVVGSTIWLIFITLLRVGNTEKPSWNPWNITIGQDGRYSNSKTQMFSWFFVLLISYISIIILRSWYGGLDFFGGVSIPQNLLILSGMSAFTYAVAKGITQAKVDKGSKAEDGIKEKKSGEAKFPYDLFHNDEGQADFGDFQMAVITLLVIVVYCVQIFNFLGTIEFHNAVTLPDVDTTLLATFGLGQGSYLVKKTVGEIGKS